MQAYQNVLRYLPVKETVLMELSVFMELSVLQYFLAAAREENISGAAEYLHLSQPTLSRQLKDLEDEPGKQLFIKR